MALTINPNHPVYISYAWKNADNPTLEDDIDRICKLMTEQGIYYKRDKDNLCPYRWNINEAENEIGEGCAILVVISEKYIKSLHCMHEWHVIKENGKIWKRVFPIILPDAQITNKKKFKEYYQYFDKRRTDLIRQQRESIVPLSTAESEAAKYDYYINDLRNMYQYLCDINTAKSIVTQNNYEVIISQLKEHITKIPGVQPIPVPFEPKFSTPVDSVKPVAANQQIPVAANQQIPVAANQQIPVAETTQHRVTSKKIKLPLLILLGFFVLCTFGFILLNWLIDPFVILGAEVYYSEGDQVEKSDTICNLNSPTITLVFDIDARERGVYDLKVRLFLDDEMITTSDAPDGYSTEFQMEIEDVDKSYYVGPNWDGDLPVGDYTAEIYYNNELCCSKKFTIVDTPFEITKVEMSVTDVHLNTIQDFGVPIYSKLTEYLTPKFHIKTLADGQYDLYFKLYSPAGLSTGTNSVGGYSSKHILNLNKQTTEYIGDGWGSNIPGNWPAGDYKVEYYYKDELIYTYNFEIYSHPFIINKVEIANVDDNDNIVTNFGDVLYSSVTQFLTPKLYITPILEGEFEIGVKFYSPDGFSEGSHSSSYTYKQTLSVDRNTTFQIMNGYGIGIPGNWGPGDYKIEFYYNDEMIFSYAFKVEK